MNYPAQGASSVRPHAVQTTSGTSSLALAYDADGNLAAQGTSTYTYDAEDRLVSRTVPGGIEQYRYDGNGNLLKRSSTADLSWTVYIGGVYELNSDGSTTKYYSALGETLASAP